MKLFHFTAAHLLKGCQEQGLTRGRVPWVGSAGALELRDGFQWLTVSPKWQQSWCDPEYSSLPYSRNAVRITVEIPKLYSKRVLRWLQFCRGNRLASSLAAFNDPENWRLFRGVVRPEWFVGVDWNPAEVREQLGGRAA